MSASIAASWRSSSTTTMPSKHRVEPVRPAYAVGGPHADGRDGCGTFRRHRPVEPAPRRGGGARRRRARRCETLLFSMPTAHRPHDAPLHLDGPYEDRLDHGSCSSSRARPRRPIASPPPEEARAAPGPLAAACLRRPHRRAGPDAEQPLTTCDKLDRALATEKGAGTAHRLGRMLGTPLMLVPPTWWGRRWHVNDETARQVSWGKSTSPNDADWNQSLLHPSRRGPRGALLADEPLTEEGASRSGANAGRRAGEHRRDRRALARELDISTAWSPPSRTWPRRDG